jgi:protein ImuA
MASRSPLQLRRRAFAVSMGYCCFVQYFIMTALLDWDDEEGTGCAPIARRRAPLRPGELPPAVEASIWRGDQIGTPTTRVVPTGYALLDAELPGGGWPGHGLTEILQAQPTVCEWRLMSPAIRQVMEANGEVVVVAPPKALHLAGLRQLAGMSGVWSGSRPRRQPSGSG